MSSYDIDTKDSVAIVNRANLQLQRYQHRVFSIQGLVCSNILQYLDLPSLLQCSQVNYQWKLLAQQISSIYQLNMQDMFYRCLNNQHGYVKHHLCKRFKDIKRFKHAQTLIMNAHVSYQKEFSSIYNDLSLFCKVRKLWIEFECDINTTVNALRFVAIQKCLSNNRHQIDTLSTCLSSVHGMSNPTNIFKPFEEITFPRLQKLVMGDQAFKFKLHDKDALAISESYNLKHLEMIGCSTSTEFWHHLEQNSNYLTNLETLILDHTFCNSFSDLETSSNIEESMKNIVLSKRLSKLKRLKIQCGDSTYGYNPNPTFLAKILKHHYLNDDENNLTTMQISCVRHEIFRDIDGYVGSTLKNFHIDFTSWQSSVRSSKMFVEMLFSIFQNKNKKTTVDGVWLTNQNLKQDATHSIETLSIDFHQILQTNATLFEKLGKSKKSLFFPNLKEMKLLNLYCDNIHKLVLLIGFIDTFVKLYGKKTKFDFSITAHLETYHAPHGVAAFKRDVMDGSSQLVELLNLWVDDFDGDDNVHPQTCTIDVECDAQYLDILVDVFDQHPHKYIKLVRFEYRNRITLHLKVIK